MKFYHAAFEVELFSALPPSFGRLEMAGVSYMCFYSTVNSKKLEHGLRLKSDGILMALLPRHEDSDVPSFLHLAGQGCSKL